MHTRAKTAVARKSPPYHPHLFQPNASASVSLPIGTHNEIRTVASTGSLKSLTRVESVYKPVLNTPNRIKPGVGVRPNTTQTATTATTTTTLPNADLTKVGTGAIRDKLTGLAGRAPVRVIPTASEGSKRELVIHGAFSEAQGRRPTMEDAHSLHIGMPSPGTSGASLTYAAVYDGHCGRHVADLAAQLLPSSVFAQKDFPADPAEAMRKAFIDTDRAIYRKIKGRDGGSTCTAVLLMDNVLYTGNLGDARAVLVEKSGHGSPLSRDHKPTVPSERSRVLSCGGFVEFGRIGGCLAVSRAFGDFEFKGGQRVLQDNYEPVVSNVPEVTRTCITDSCEAIIVACDGLWDVVTNDDAARCVLGVLATETAASRTQACKRAADALVQLAMRNHTTDNVTAVVISLRKQTGARH